MEPIKLTLHKKVAGLSGRYDIYIITNICENDFSWI